MKILEFYTRFFPKKGGVERHIYDLCKVSLRRGHNPVVLALDPPKPSSEVVDGIIIYRVQFPKIFRVLIYPKIIYLVFQMIRVMRSYDIDIIHAHDYSNGILSAFVGRILRKPVVVTLHLQTWRTDFFSSPKSFFLDFAEWILGKFLAYNVKGIICVSRFTHIQAAKLGLPQCKLTVIYNWVSQVFGNGEVSVKGGEWQGKPFILSVGRLDDRQKGFSVLIRALRILRDEGFKIDLVIVGEGPDRNMYVKMSEKLDINDHVHILNNIPDRDLRYLYSQCTVFCLPSHFEALPIVILEAMSFGKPVVATKVGGIPEIIKNEINGILVGPTHRDVANGIAQLISNDELLRRISKNGRQTILDKFSEKNCYKTIELFEKLALNP